MAALALPDLPEGALGPSRAAAARRPPAAAWVPPRLAAVAVVVLLMGAALVAPLVQAAGAAPAFPIRSLHRHHRGRRWGMSAAAAAAALGRARGGADASSTAQSAPGFFTIAERFQALAATAEDDDEVLEDEDGNGDGDGDGKRPAEGREERALRAALQYSVVAIVGPQASGKSTLLNALFGTRFPVLDAKATGVQRTTRGVWVDLSSSRPAASSSSAASASAGPPLVVLDTEGLESVARGVEGSGLFDRQVSTLAVAAADLILLNLWARDVRGGRLLGGEGAGRGGEEGAGLHAELLRALVQRAGQGQGQGVGRAVSLVVVLRDSEHASGDLAVARDAVRRALEEAAEALELLVPAADAGAATRAKGKARRKGGPEEAGAAAEAAADHEEQVLVVAGVRVAFAALPSRVFQAPEFAAAAEGLRDRLLRAVLPPPSGAASSLSSSSEKLQPVPLPRFPSFAEQLWASIVAESGGIVGGEGAAAGGTGQAGGQKKGGSPKEERRCRAEEQAQVRAFVRRTAVESCCAEAEPAAGRLERKVEAATEMPILEFGRDAEAILQAARRTLRGRLAGCGDWRKKDREVAAAEAEAVAALSRRLEPCFRQHVEALGDFYFGKFQDKFLGMYHPAPRLEKEAAALMKDVLGAFDRAAAAAVPAEMKAASGSGTKTGVWAGSVEATRARLKDEMDLEVADRKMEVEVLFPTTDELERAGLGRRFFLRPSWWRKVALKALVIYINYLQTVQAAQSLARSARRRQERYPPVPLF